MSPTESAPERNGPAKATLFCPDCGHQSGYDGDWVVVERRQETGYRCPDCHAVLTTRPTQATDGPGHAFETYWRAWDRSVRAWRGLWRRFLAP